MINDLIRYTHEMGWGQAIYDSGPLVNAIMVFIMAFVYRRKYGFSIKQSVITSVVFIVAIIALSAATAWIGNGFEDIRGMNVLRVYVYLPLICILLARVLKRPARVMISYTSIFVMVWQIIGQAVCPFLGCCAGFSCKWGVWNPMLNELVFPTQWLICLATCGMLFWLLQCEKKYGYGENGKIYPIMLVIYGGIRFLLEFLKRGERVLFGVSELGFQALFMILIGTIWLLAAYEINVERERSAEFER